MQDIVAETAECLWTL